MAEVRDFNLRRRTRVMIRILYNVGLVVRIIIRGIVHRIRVEDCIFTVVRRHQQLGCWTKCSSDLCNIG